MPEASAVLRRDRGCRDHGPPALPHVTGEDEIETLVARLAATPRAVLPA